MNFSIKKITQTILGLIIITTLQFNAIADTAIAGKYQIDPSHTTVLFKISHLGMSHMTGRFNSFSGDMELNPNGISRVAFSINTASVDTNHEKRDKHLRSPDFLNVKQFPKIDFVSKKVTINSHGELVKILGNLSLHGKTKPVTFTVTPVGAGKDPWGAYRAGYNVTTVIQRSAYGMNFMQAGGIGDNIEITLNIETVKQ